MGQNALILAAGVAAGAINAAVGSGTLTFPVLLACGYPPVIANVSNTLGIVPGSLAGAYEYRQSITGRHGLVLRLAAASTVGAVVGAVLLLTLPPAAFKAIVPAFIAFALVLVVLQPFLVRYLRARTTPREHPRAGPGLLAAIFAIGMYGGYFGAAQSIVLLAVLAILLRESFQGSNGIKNILAGLANLTAGIVFALATQVDWTAAGLIACGSLVGGVVGGRLGRRMPEPALRGAIVAVGVYAIWVLT